MKSHDVYLLAISFPSSEIIGANRRRHKDQAWRNYSPVGKDGDCEMSLPTAHSVGATRRNAAIYIGADRES